MSKSKSDLLVENVVGFPNNRIYYTREEVPMNQKVYNYMESSTPEKSNEELFDNERCESYIMDNGHYIIN